MFEEVPASFCGTSLSSSESVGLRFFALGKSLGFFTSADFFSPFCFFGLSFPRGGLERSLMRPCGSIAADSWYLYRCSFSRSGSLSSSRDKSLNQVL